MAKNKLGYTVNGLHFPTKKALTAHCSSILNKRGPLVAEDSAFLASLLERHPERDLKVGVGVKRFYVGGNEYGGRCFWLERVDGSHTDFAFTSCITPPTHETDVRKALRHLITGQVVAFRDSAFMSASHVQCAITGEMVDSDGAHVDHRPPMTFQKVVEAFLAARSLTFDKIAVVPTTDGDTVCRLVDGELARAWEGFHQQHAILQIVTKRANLSQGNRVRKAEPRPLAPPSSSARSARPRLPRARSWPNSPTS